MVIRKIPPSINDPAAYSRMVVVVTSLVKDLACFFAVTAKILKVSLTDAMVGIYLGTVLTKIDEYC